MSDENKSSLMKWLRNAALAGAIACPVIAGGIACVSTTPPSKTEAATENQTAIAAAADTLARLKAGAPVSAEELDARIAAMEKAAAAWDAMAKQVDAAMAASEDRAKKIADTLVTAAGKATEGTPVNGIVYLLASSGLFASAAAWINGKFGDKKNAADFAKENKETKEEQAFLLAELREARAKAEKAQLEVAKLTPSPIASPITVVNTPPAAAGGA